MKAVENVLEILWAGIEETIVGLGRNSVTELTPADVVAAPGFCVCGRSSLPDSWVPSQTARPRSRTYPVLQVVVDLGSGSPGAPQASRAIGFRPAHPSRERDAQLRA